MKNLIMNKKFQIAILWTFLVIAAITCLFSLAYATNFRLYDNKAVNYRYAAAYLNEYQNTTEWGYTNSVGELIGDGATKACNDIVDSFISFCDDLNKTNNYLFVSQALIVALFAVICIFGNKYRKKYYLSNLISGVVAGSAAIILNVVGIVLNNKVISDYDGGHLYMAAAKAYTNQSDALNDNYQKAMMIFLIVGIVFYAIFIAFTVLKYIFSKDKDAVAEIETSNDDSTNLSVEEAQ